MRITGYLFLTTIAGCYTAVQGKSITPEKGNITAILNEDVQFEWNISSDIFIVVCNMFVYVKNEKKKIMSGLPYIISKEPLGDKLYGGRLSGIIENGKVVITLQNVQLNDTNSIFHLEVLELKGIFRVNKYYGSIKITVEDAQHCRSSFQKSGCFKRTPLVIPDLIVTDRDVTHANYSGHAIDWNNYPHSLRSLACRCHTKAKDDGYRFFSLGFYGECFAGKDDQKYANLLNSTDKYADNCVNGNSEICDDRSQYECVGKANAEYIYYLN